MLYPEISKLMRNMPSRYSLVIAAAKRARQLAQDGATPMVGEMSDKYVSMAVGEIAEGAIYIEGKNN